MTFKEKLVKLRKLKGITQDEFASAVGVSRQAVYKWESGQSYPEVSKLLEIKALFNISIDDLLDDNYEDGGTRGDELEKAIRIVDLRQKVGRKARTGARAHQQLVLVAARGHGDEGLGGKVAKRERTAREWTVCGGVQLHPLAV